MRLIVGLLACSCAYQASQVLAADPPQPTAAPVQPGVSAPAASPSSSSSTPATPAATSASSSTAATSDSVDHRLRSQGYKPEVKNGTTYYCRKEPQLGSRFDQKVCATPEQLASIREDSKAMLDKIQRTRAGPQSN